MTGANSEQADPLKNPAFRPPGLGEKLREAIFGASRPLRCVQIEVTSHCFGKCVYCPHTTQAGAWKSRHMSAGTFATLWPILRKSQRAHLQGWGEPLLNPRFFDFAELAARAGCQVSTTSCGLKMTDSLARRIIASGLNLIAFSLAGTDAESNKARENVDFEAVCESIRLLRRHVKNSGAEEPLEIHIAYLMLADRMEAAARLPALMDELDVDMAVVSTLDYLALPSQKDLAFAPFEERKIARARALLEKAAAEAEKNGRFLHFSLPGPDAAAHAGGCRENALSCLYVDADGRVSPCVYLNVPGADPASSRRVYGDCAREDPWEIWRKEEYRLFRKKLAENRPDDACLNCPKRFER